MKKLGKLSINPEKYYIKNGELENCKGGYGEGSYTCECRDENKGTVHYTGSIDECTKEERWVENNCWEIHKPYSDCGC